MADWGNGMPAPVAPAFNLAELSQMTNNAEAAMRARDQFQQEQQVRQQQANFMYPQNFQVSPQVLRPLTENTNVPYRDALVDSSQIQNQASRGNVVFKDGKPYEIFTNPQTGSPSVRPMEQQPPAKNSRGPSGERDPAAMGDKMLSPDELHQKAAESFGGSYDSKTGSMTIPANALTQHLLQTAYPQFENNIGDIYKSARPIPGAAQVQSFQSQPRETKTQPKNPWEQSVRDKQAEVNSFINGMGPLKEMGADRKQKSALGVLRQELKDVQKRRDDWVGGRAPKSEDAPQGYQDQNGANAPVVSPTGNDQNKKFLELYQSKPTQDKLKIDKAIQIYMNKHKVARFVAEQWVIKALGE